MPPKNRSRVATPKSKPKVAPTRRSTRRTAQDGDVPGVYQEMLANLPDEERTERPVKRRKHTPDSDSLVATSPRGSPKLEVDNSHEAWHSSKLESAIATVPEAIVQDSTLQNTKPNTPLRQTLHHQEQIVYDDSATDSDESTEFEDVEINGVSQAGPTAPRTTDRASGPLTISLNIPWKTLPRRRQITKADRLHRLAVHKWHYLCLLLHMATVNTWCNNSDVQASLKKLVPRKLIARIHRDGTQAERKFAFDSAMIEVNSIWAGSFRKTERGMKRAAWRDLTVLDLGEEMESAPEPVDFDDFKECAQARQRQGSPDLGSQLFCALCRALAIDTRLVCSLQVLPFAMAGSKSGGKSTDEYIQAGEQDFGSSTIANGRDPSTFSKYPVWWIEVLNPAIDQWIAVDPDPNHQSYNQPRTHYEPPASDGLNSMSYVVAFEENGTAKDVTRRYTSAFNAKTRKTRVENTKDGERWLSDVMFFFAKSEPEPRDQIEDAELHRRVALEGMPRNVQDFKDHPVYVLERHLRATEVIEPKKECGRLKVGKDKLETVYRREHVHACRTADGWYRRGRNVVDGSQPLRHIPKRRGPNNEEEEPFSALYAEYQTEVYVPPEIRSGRVPRNAFGNLDVYVPTMIPMGGAHIRHPFAIKAAKALGIDHAEAVTGFKFKGRQGTAIMDGIVIAAEHLSVIKDVISAIEEVEIDETNDARDAILERLWAAMMRVLRVQEMVQVEYGNASTRKVQVPDDIDDEDETGLEDDPDDDDDLIYEDAGEGGGFDVEATEATAETRAEEAAQLSALRENRPISLPPPVVRQKITAVLSPHKPVLPKPPLAQEESYNDLFDGDPIDVSQPDMMMQRTRDESVEGGGFLDEEVQGGGFVDEEVEGGGFIITPEDSPHPWGLGLGSNLQEHESGDRHTDDMNVSPGLPIRDNMSEAAPSPDPVSTPDYSNMASFTRNSESYEEAQTGRGRSSPEDTVRPKGTIANLGNEADETDSMPSHDPDEDDMEPEWVANAFSPEF